MASEMPVLPLVGSRMVSPGRSRPASSAARTMNSAARSLMLPVGFRSSSFAQSRTGGAPSGTVGESRGSPTSGVPPQASSRLSYRAIAARPQRAAARVATAWAAIAAAAAKPNAPPATAGRTVTLSPSLSLASSAPRKRTSSSLT